MVYGFYCTNNAKSDQKFCHRASSPDILTATELRRMPLPFVLVRYTAAQWNTLVSWNAGAGVNVDSWEDPAMEQIQLRTAQFQFRWKELKMPLLLSVDINTPVLCLPTKPPCAGGTALIVSSSDMMRFGPKLVGGSWDSTKFWSFLLRCQRLLWSLCGSEPGRHTNEKTPWALKRERANAPFAVLQRGCAVVKVRVGFQTVIWPRSRFYLGMLCFFSVAIWSSKSCLQWALLGMTGAG